MKNPAELRQEYFETLERMRQAIDALGKMNILPLGDDPFSVMPLSFQSATSQAKTLAIHLEGVKSSLEEIMEEKHEA